MLGVRFSRRNFFPFFVKEMERGDGWRSFLGKMVAIKRQKEMAKYLDIPLNGFGKGIGFWQSLSWG